MAWVSNTFINKLFCPFQVNLKARDIHFLDVSETETIFIVSAWLFYMNQNFFRFKGKLSLNRTVCGIIAIIFKGHLNFCLKEPLKVHCHDTDCLI